MLRYEPIYHIFYLKYGKKAAEIVRENNISEQTFYRWKSKYGGMEISEAKRLKQLEEENRRLKEMVAELSLDNLTPEEYALKLSYNY